MDMPFLKFFVRDWQADQQLRLCSLEARGCWLELLLVMHGAKRRGYLEDQSGVPLTDEQIATLIGTFKGDLYRCKRELLKHGVPGVDENGCWYSRRMVKEEHKRRLCSEAAKGRGNPALKKTEEQTPDTIDPDTRGCLKVTFKGDLVTGDAPTVERTSGFTLQECLDASVAIGMPREDVEAFFAHYDQYDWIGSQGRKITKLSSALAKWKSQRQNHAPKQVGRANGQTPAWARKKAAEEALAPLRNKNYPTNEQAAEMRRLKKIIAECNAELSA